LKPDRGEDVALPTSRIDASPPLPRAGQNRPAGARLDFQSLVSSLNPLMYAPVVGGIYSSATGERPIPAMRIFVATLLAGPIGLVAAVADSVVEEATGKTIVEQAIAAIVPDGAAPPGPAIPAETPQAQARPPAPLRLIPPPAESPAAPERRANASTAQSAPARPRSLLPPAA
jgi:hypothetical protein